MKWIEAVKIWNAKHNPETWCIPRKSTPEYLEVRAIMEGKPSPKKVKAERSEKVIEQLRVVEKETTERNKARKEAPVRRKLRNTTPPQKLTKRDKMVAEHIEMALKDPVTYRKTLEHLGVSKSDIDEIMNQVKLLKENK